MKFQEVPITTPDDFIVFIECDITGKTKKTTYGAAKANVIKNNGQYITNWGLTKLNNPMKSNEVKDKIKQTNMEKYGATIAMNSPENIAKRKKQYEDPEFVKARAEAHKKTCLERYGVEHHMHTDELKEKVKNTNLEKYGVEAPLQNPEILAKVQATNLERYGDVCSLNNPEVKAKALKSLFEHYGVEYYNQLPEMREYLRENCTKWLKACYENPWAKGITRPEEWIEKQRKTVIRLILEGKWFGGYGKGKIQGWYNPVNPKCKKDNPYFRSSPELIAHHYLQFNDDVDWYDYEPFGIEYKLPDDSVHEYVVDFAVKYKNNDTISLIEVKPRFKLLDEKVVCKQVAAIKLAEEEGLIYEYWDEYLIKSWGYKLDDIKKLPSVKLREQKE